MLSKSLYGGVRIGGRGGGDDGGGGDGRGGGGGGGSGVGGCGYGRGDCLEMSLNCWLSEERID